MNKPIDRWATVMVRAFQDEPVLLNVVGSHKGLIHLAGTDPKNTIGFRRDRVYIYDAGSFRTLLEAHKAADTAALQNAWGRAIRYG